MSDAPALGSKVVVPKAGRFQRLSVRKRTGPVVRIDLGTDRAAVKLDSGIYSFPYDDLREASDDPLALWFDYRDHEVQTRGIAPYSLSRRDFLAGYAAANAA